MIKILKAPLQLEPFLEEFKDLFTKPSYGSFRDLCAALSVCDKSKTVANLCDTMADCLEGKRHVLRTIGSLATQIGTKMKLHSANWTFLLINYL